MAERGLELVALGETMIRLMPRVGIALERASTLEVEIAGAESNVAIGFARLGHRTAWISRLPANSLGRLIANRVREHGVEVSRVSWTGAAGRVGLYYWEDEAPPRSGRVVYDRARSAFSQAEPDDIDWDYVRTARRIHLTGITAALGPPCRRLLDRALAVAEESDIAVSFDVNYRAQLWTASEAADVLSQLLGRAAILFCSSRDASTLFGLTCPPEEQAAELAGRFAIPLVAVTCGGDGAVAWDGSAHRAEAVDVVPIDPVGRGDAFVAGFLHGIGDGDIGRALRCGVGLAALKQTYRGDVSWATLADLEGVVSGQSIAIER